MLRFKKDDGTSFPEWQEYPLSKLLKERKEKAIKDGTYEHVSLTKEGVVPKSERYERDFLVKSDDKAYKITRLNDICYNPANLKFGVICRNKYKEGIFSPIYITFETTPLVLPEFIEGLVTRTDFINYSLKYQEGTVYERMAVSPEDLLKIKVKIPCIEEQKKIVELLQAIDERIAIQDEAVADIQAQKLSVIDKIFAQAIRFSKDDKTAFPDWETHKIGDCFQIMKGAGLSKADISENNNGTPFILYGELYTTYHEIATQIVRTTEQEVDEKYYSHAGDVIIPTSGESADEISTATCVMQDGVILAGDLNIFRSKKMDGRFFSYMMNHHKKYDVARIAQGASIVHIQADEIKKISIPVPCMEEQKKISDFLQIFDEQIEAQKQIAEDYKVMKKALLQQLFE